MDTTRVNPVEVELERIWAELLARVGDKSTEFERDILDALRKSDGRTDQDIAAAVRAVLDEYFPDGIEDLLDSSSLLRGPTKSPRWRGGEMQLDADALQVPPRDMHIQAPGGPQAESLREDIDLAYEPPLEAAVGPSGTTRPDSLRRIVVPVWYATNRKRKTNSDGKLADKPYGGDVEPSAGAQDAPMHFGVAQISVPDKRDIGTMPTPRWWRLEFATKPEKHFYVYSTVETDGEDAWLSDLRAHLRPAPDADASSTENDLLVYIHGYNTDWQSDVERAAQIGLDLNFRGPVVSFSWPSRGAAADYEQDVRLVDVSRLPFAKLLQKLAEESGARRIYVIAHSLGNRVALQALTDATRVGTPAPAELAHFIFAAPDVDGDYFTQQMGVFSDQIKLWSPARVPRLTLYACSADKALEFSRWLSGARRAGDARPTIEAIFPPAEYIDATKLVEGDPHDDSWGHSYFCSNSGVIKDMVDALQGTPAAKRWGLEAVTITGAGTYFSMKGQN